MRVKEAEMQDEESKRLWIAPTINTAQYRWSHRKEPSGMGNWYVEFQMQNGQRRFKWYNNMMWNAARSMINRDSQQFQAWRVVLHP
jgi:hypothetical protein